VSFAGRLAEAIALTDSLLCLGIDPDIERLPDVDAMERDCDDLLDACLPYAVAVKPNIAFFEQYGPEGLSVLLRLRARVPADRILLIDAKRGDIGSTAVAYARALFDVYGADAITASPLLGEDAVRPLLDRPGRGCFLLTRTSNPSAADILELELADGTLIYEHIATLAVQWDLLGNAGLIVGATAPAAIAAVRRRAMHLPILVPGVGAQGGALEASADAALDSEGGGVLVSVSRGIALADDRAAAASGYAQRLREVRRARGHGVPAVL
jgi:orotidine 5'-phosphate decarboxylase subfamily 2